MPHTPANPQLPTLAIASAVTAAALLCAGAVIGLGAGLFGVEPQAFAGIGLTVACVWAVAIASLLVLRSFGDADAKIITYVHFGAAAVRVLLLVIAGFALIKLAQFDDKLTLLTMAGTYLAVLMAESVMVGRFVRSKFDAQYVPAGTEVAA